MTEARALAQEQGAGGRLSIDLGAVAENWRALKAMSRQAECAAAVKADAYGLGINQVAHALWKAGCRTFFTALPEEGIELRNLLPKAKIYVLSGFLPGAYALYKHYSLQPVINTELAKWHNSSKAEPLPYALQVETGMNRLGARADEEGRLPFEQEIMRHPPSLLISHLACADTPEHPLNAQQLKEFAKIRRRYPALPGSLANSAGIFLGPSYHHNLTRPGIALYGGACQKAHVRKNPMKPAVRLEARILQIKPVPAGQTIGYGGSETVKPLPGRNSGQRFIGTLAVGYADGYLRAAGGSDQHCGAFAAWRGYKMPLIGRISMDLITIDMSAHPDIEQIAHDNWHDTWVELIGPALPLDEVAQKAGTIGYELLTSMGRRYHRIYKN